MTAPAKPKLAPLFRGWETDLQERLTEIRKAKMKANQDKNSAQVAKLAAVEAVVQGVMVAVSCGAAALENA